MIFIILYVATLIIVHSEIPKLSTTPKVIAEFYQSVDVSSYQLCQPSNDTVTLALTMKSVSPNYYGTLDGGLFATFHRNGTMLNSFTAQDQYGLTCHAYCQGSDAYLLQRTSLTGVVYHVNKFGSTGSMQSQIYYNSDNNAAPNKELTAYNMTVDPLTNDIYVAGFNQILALFVNRHVAETGNVVSWFAPSEGSVTFVKGIRAVPGEKGIVYAYGSFANIINGKPAITEFYNVFLVRVNLNGPKAFTMTTTTATTSTLSQTFSTRSSITSTSTRSSTTSSRTSSVRGSSTRTTSSFTSTTTSRTTSQTTTTSLAYFAPQQTGTVDWTAVVGSTAGSDVPAGMTISQDGSFVILFGYSGGNFDGNANQGGYDCFITRFDVILDGNGSSSVEKTWSTMIGTPFTDQCFTVAIDNRNGQLFLAGNSSGLIVPDHPELHRNPTDLFIYRMNASTGVTLDAWSWAVSGSRSAAVGLLVDEVNNILYIIGTSAGALFGVNLNPSGNTVFLAKIQDAPVTVTTSTIKTATTTTARITTQGLTTTPGVQLFSTVQGIQVVSSAGVLVTQTVEIVVNLPQETEAPVEQPVFVSTTTSQLVIPTISQADGTQDIGITGQLLSIWASYMIYIIVGAAVLFLIIFVTIYFCTRKPKEVVAPEQFEFKNTPAQPASMVSKFETKTEAQQAFTMSEVPIGDIDPGQSVMQSQSIPDQFGNNFAQSQQFASQQFAQSQSINMGYPPADIQMAQMGSFMQMAPPQQMGYYQPQQPMYQQGYDHQQYQQQQPGFDQQQYQQQGYVQEQQFQQQPQAEANPDDLDDLAANLAVKFDF